jgi:adenylate kinase
MNIALLGPFGAGKGTQAAKLVTRFGFLNISTGDLFREHLKNRTGLGLLIQKYLDQGSLVPDEVAEATMEEWLLVSDPHKSILFDGFPRTVRQAQFLETYFLEIRRTLDAVVYLKASDDELVKRLSARWVCGICHIPFHQTVNPFKTCPYNQCRGERLTQRDEDRPENVRVRLKVFHEETEPVVDFYRANQKLIVVDAERSIDLVFQSIVQIVQYKTSQSR